MYARVGTGLSLNLWSFYCVSFADCNYPLVHRFNAISVFHANNPGVNTTELFFLFLLFHCSSHSNKLITCSYSILQQKKFRSCNLATKNKLIVIIYLQKKS